MKILNLAVTWTAESPLNVAAVRAPDDIVGVFAPGHHAIIPVPLKLVSEESSTVQVGSIHTVKEMEWKTSLSDGKKVSSRIEAILSL